MTDAQIEAIISAGCQRLIWRGDARGSRSHDSSFEASLAFENSAPHRLGSYINLIILGWLTPRA